MCNEAGKILWPRARQSHNPAVDVAMVWSSLWVTGLRALEAKSVIYDCLVTIIVDGPLSRANCTDWYPTKKDLMAG